VLALQRQVALLTCPAASDAAPPPAVSPPEVRGRDKEGAERARARASERARAVDWRCKRRSVLC